MQVRLRSRHRRARVALLAGFLVLVALATGAALRGDGPAPGEPLVPGTDEAAPFPDPFAYDPDREDELTRRAAAGNSHILYARSPDGAAATAARVARYRGPVEEAAEQAGVDADLLEGLVFLESAGRPDAMAGDTEGAVGLTQILAETGQNLLGMQIDVGASSRLTRQIARRERHRLGVERLRAQRRVIDERFDPAKALEATARYLIFARKELGRADLAFVSYHMGVGNLQSVIAAYGQEEPSYARLFFDSTPATHPEVTRMLMRFGDDSSNYLWKVYAAAEIMRLYREDPEELARRQALQGAKNSAEEMLHPQGPTPQFADPGALRRAYDDGEVVAFPDDPARTALRRDRRMGELAGRLGVDRLLYQGLRPDALAMALYIGAQVRSYAGGNPALIVTSTVRDQAYQDLLVRRNREATRNYSLHTTGWAFDVARVYRDGRHAEAFQFVLDRLQAMNVIAWVREPDAIHITASAEAAKLRPLLERLDPEG
jgi:soluble lytic murein transglycosylase-like protein